MAKERCPCTPERAYSECCRPFHRGQAEPPTAEALMRSRFSAFAKREVGYLWKTLDAQHEDRAREEADVLRELRATCHRFQYVRLEVLSFEPSGEQATVGFRAHVFENGKNRSFEELSHFRYDGTGWRYVSGEPRLRSVGKV